MQNTIEQLNNEGVQYFLRGKFEEAKLRYQEALDMNPSYATTLNNFGMMFLQEKKFEKAESFFNKALDENITSTYLLNLGHAQANQGKLNEAQINYEKAIELNPKSLDGLKSLASLFQYKNEYHDAIRIWEYIILNISSDVGFKLQLAKAYIKIGENQYALSILHEASKQEKQQEITWYYTALIHFNAKNLGLAKTAILRAITIKPEEVSFRSLLAAIYLGLSEFNSAITEWDYILNNQPENHKIRIDKAVSLLATKKLTECIDELNIVLRSNQVPKALYYKAVALLQLNKKDLKAIEILKKLVELKTEFSEESKNILHNLTL